MYIVALYLSIIYVRKDIKYVAHKIIATAYIAE
jgi:hypothetical protein